MSDTGVIVRRLSRRLASAALTTLVLAPLAPLAPLGAAAAEAATTAPTTHRVGYRGVAVDAPVDWPVVDLDADPQACVRLDVHAVYLGTQGADARCPAHAVGRTETVWLAAAGSGVQVRTTVGTHPQDVDRVLASLTPAGTPVSRESATSPSSSRSPATSPAAPPAAAAGQAAPAAAVTGRTFTGMAFDACAAPSVAAMSAWRASPYRAVGIYIGGSMRACGDGNLSATWVAQVGALGFAFVPIYVGVQAPCVDAPGLATIDPATAAAQGVASADDAVGRARAFGIGAGSPVYYDLEGYDNRNASCVGTVLGFVSAWDGELHRLGYRGAVYGNGSSLMTDLSRTVGTGRVVLPDDIWYAQWNDLQTTSAQASYAAFKDAFWSRHQRQHQYAGDVTRSWAGTTMSVDESWADADVAGVAVPVGYGADATGPGGSGFVLTGPMTYWRSGAPAGAAHLARWTVSNGSTECNGATWSPALAAGSYDVQVLVPAVGATARAHYTVHDAAGATSRLVDQRAASGYVSLGVFQASATVPITLHVGDDDPTSMTAVIGVDLARFVPVGPATGRPSPPAAPPGLTAAVAPFQATLAWGAAVPNGSPVTGYTVTATPGGPQLQLPAGARAVVLQHLVEGRAYTFAVTATSAAGPGPAATVAATVRGVLRGFHPVVPVRVVDTRSGTVANPGVSRLAAGSLTRVRVAGAVGSGVPAGAAAVVVNVTVVGASRPGYVLVSASGVGSTSTVNVGGPAPVSDLVVSAVNADGTVVVRNASSGPVDVVLDVTGYYSADASGVGLHPVVPVRVVDTRSGTVANPGVSRLAAGSLTRVRVAGAVGSGVPAGAAAVVVNVTVVGASRPGYVLVSASGVGSTSTVNVGGPAPVSDLVVSAVNADGTVVVRNASSGPVDVVLDVTGYYSADASGVGLHPVVPVRVVDTRSGTVANPGVSRLAAGSLTRVRVAGAVGSGVPAGAAAVVVNVTVVGASRPGYVLVSASGVGSTSTVNVGGPAPVSDLVVSAVNADGTVVVRNASSGPVDVVLDVTGYHGP